MKVIMMIMIMIMKRMMMDMYESDNDDNDNDSYYDFNDDNDFRERGEEEVESLLESFRIECAGLLGVGRGVVRRG